MYEQILLPVDGSDGATETVNHVAALADGCDASVTVVFVADTNRDSVTRVQGEVVDAFVDTGEEIVGEAGQVLATRGVDYDTDVVQGGPARTITEYADRYEYDLIAMATHGRTGISRRLLGSVTERVLQLSPCPVLTLRMAEEMRVTFPYEDILLATDGSEAATAAVSHGLDLASALDATPHILSVVEPTSVLALGPDADATAAAQSTVDDAASMARERGVAGAVTAVEEGTPHEEIRAYAEAEDVDAVVLGTTGQRGIDDMLLGTVAEMVVRTASVPVVAVPR